MNTPSTGTSSGSVLTKEPDAQRPKLEHAASCSVPVPQSTAGLVLDLRRSDSEQQEQPAADVRGLALPGSPDAGAPQNLDDFHNVKVTDDSEVEAVGSDTSSDFDKWRPKPREETLEGQTFEQLAAKLTKNFPEDDKAPLEEGPEKVEKLEKQASDAPNNPPACGSEQLLAGRTATIEPWSGKVPGQDTLLPKTESDETPAVSGAMRLRLLSQSASPESSPLESSMPASSDAFGFCSVFKSTSDLSAPRQEEHEDCTSPPILTPLGPSGQGGLSPVGSHANDPTSSPQR